MMRIPGVFAALLILSSSSATHAQLEPAPQHGPPSAAAQRAAALASESVELELAGDHKRALERAEAAISADPDDAWAYYMRSDALVSLGHTADAVKTFETAEQRFPESDPWGRSVAIWGAGNAFEEVGRCSDAAPIYTRYAQQVERDDPTAAAFARRRAQKQCSPPSPPRLSRAEIDSATFETLGDYAQALEQAELAIRERPTDGYGYYMRGDALLSQKRFDEAVSSYRDAEQHFGAAETHERSLAIWGQANALKEAGRCREASPIFLRYATLVEAHDAAGAALARENARKSCVPIAAKAAGASRLGHDVSDTESASLRQ